MNRRITFLGLFILLIAIALIVSPIAIYGSLQIDIEFEIGVMGLPVGLSVILGGASSPDPGVTTVGGVFGNPDENFLRRLEKSAPFDPRLRFQPSPKEPANCRQCYTLITWDAAECPRCGRRRECRGCGRPLFYLSGAVRCAPCVRDEVYCNCVKMKRTTPAATGPRVRSR